MVNRNKISLEQTNVQTEKEEENYFGDSSSVCSDEASNYPEEQEFVSKVNTNLTRRRNAHKRYQVATKNNLWKKKGQTKVDKKMRILQHLIPNCSKVDNDCVLDEAIVYIKNLQNQLQYILSANALATEMYTWRLQPLPQPNIMHNLYASSIIRDAIFSCLPTVDGNRIQMPPSEMFIQHPSQMSNSLPSASFSPYGSLIPFPSM